MDARFKPKAGRFGVAPVFLVGKQLDAGITASNTVQIPVATPFRKLYVARLTVHCATVAIGGSTITATLQKKPVGVAAVALNTANDIKAAFITSTNTSFNIPLLATLTDAQKILNEGDFLYVDVTAAGTVTTQPVGLIFTVECLVLE